MIVLSVLLAQLLSEKRRVFDERRLNGVFSLRDFFFCHCLSSVLNDRIIGFDSERVFNFIYSFFVYGNYRFDRGFDREGVVLFKRELDGRLMSVIGPFLSRLEQGFFFELPEEEVMKAGIGEKIGGFENLAINVGHIV